MKKHEYIIGIILVVLPVIIWLIFLHDFEFSTEPSDWASFANYLSGTVGLIITFFGFLIIIKTFNKQIMDTKDQAYDSYVSSFETTIFKLNEYNHFIKSNIEYSKDKVGLLAVYEYAVDISNLYQEEAGRIGERKDHYQLMKNYVSDTYPQIYENGYYKIGHWLRHLYHVYKYIDTSKLSKNEKEKYAKLIRSEMSSEEMILIGFNGMTIYGEKFKEIIEKYQLLHRLMNMNYLRALFISYYDKNAFGDEDIYNTNPENKTSDMWYYNILKENA